MLTGLVGCGVLLALLGWLGLALHWSRWTWQGQGLWRASSTLTYPNATAIILAMLALVTLSCLTAAQRSMPLVLSTTVLLTGLVATLSRAGLLAMAVGVVVLAAVRGPRALTRAGWPAALGASVAALGLFPTMTTGSPRPAAAVTALVAGLAVTAGAVTVRLNRVAAGGLTVLALGLSMPWWTGLTSITGTRLRIEDPERAASFSAAVQVFDQHRLIGAGPSLPTLTWTTGSGSSVYRYAHNEYLQVLAELGIVGGLLLAALLATLLRRLYQCRRTGGAVSAGVLAATTALALHAGFDFVWHIPAIPLVAAALVGLASPETPVGRITQPAGGGLAKGVPMNTQRNANRTKAIVVSAALAGGAALALLSPSSPALAYYSGGLHLDVTAQSPASLVSRGAAVDVPVDIDCNATRYASVSLRVTERVGSQTATGYSYVNVACNGGHQRVLIQVTAASGKAFAKGSAVASAQIYGCNQSTCGSESSNVTIQITR